MSQDALLAAWLRQRIELGESRIFLDAPAPAAPSGAQPAAVTAADPGTAALASSDTEEPAWMKNAPAIPGPGLVRDDPGLLDATAAMDLDTLVGTIASCTRCGLCEGRTHTVPGEGPADARLMVVGEGPGQTEDELGRPFVGRAGKLLDDILASIGCPRSTVYICNTVKCRPPGNRTPAPEELEACAPYLRRQIQIIRPRVILAVGSTAAGALLATRQPLGQLRNHVHRYNGIPVIVTYHPAALLRNPGWKKHTWDDIRIARRILDSDS